MLVAAAGASPADPAIFAGAALFYASDLTVARDRFVASGFANGAIGLPLYFAAQLVIAHTVASAAG
jgi:phage shock protein PspC (stress-responsive transcriptional regulator)